MEEISRDPEIEGGEDEKNRCLAPAPQATNEDGTPILPSLETGLDKKITDVKSDEN